MLFYWNSSLETGNELIDRQHRRLFDLTNDLARQVGLAGRLPVVGELVASLRDYAAHHFCDEEQIMACAHLKAPEQERHVCAHRAFIQKVDEIAARTDLSESEAVEEFLEFLVTWLVMHILRMDRRIVRSLKEGIIGDDTGDTSVERVLIRALNETERRFRMISDEAPAMIWISSRSGQRDYANRTWYEYVGADANAKDGPDWDSFIHPDDLERYRVLLADLVAEPRRVETELRIRRPDGSWGWILERILPRINGDQCVGFVAAASDVTMIKRSEVELSEANRRLEQEVAQRTGELERLALSDPLTGVGNRRVAYDRLARDAKACRQGGNPVSVLYIDIDFFKNVNDEFGHAVGDEVLIAIARTLSAGLRSGDTLCRIGGEEFLAILNDCDAVAAFRTGERLRASVARQIFVRVGRPVTVSIGVATLICGESDEDLIRRADEALLEAKRAGRNRVCRWMPAVEAAV